MKYFYVYPHYIAKNFHVYYISCIFNLIHKLKFYPNLNLHCREFFMELTRRSVYPSHKIDVPDIEEDTTGSEEVDSHIQPHYFDLPNDSKCSFKKKFVPLLKPNEIQRKCVGVHPNFFHVNESKIIAFVKLGIFDEKWKSLLERIKIFE